MHNVWRVMWFEYVTRVRRRSFLLLLFGVPVVMVLFWGLLAWLAVRDADTRPFGYVDEAGVVQEQGSVVAELMAATYLPFATRVQAHEALAAEEIAGYYVIPPDYWQTHQIEAMVWDEAVPTEQTILFEQFVEQNLQAQLSAEARALVTDVGPFEFRQVDSDEVLRPSTIQFILGLGFVFLFTMVIFSFSPYLLRIVSDEKENRTMELMMTMVSPEAMIYGKLLGLTAVFGTQMVVWGGLFVVVALGSLVALQVVPYTFLLLVLLFGVPTFMMLVAIMTAIGSVTANLEQGQQMAGMVNWVFTFPLFFVLIALVDPNNPLMVGLTFFPLTAFAAVIMRWAMGATPLWQVVVSWLLVVMTAVWMMLLAVRVFRVGMLEYGQRLGWSTIWRVVRGGEK